MILLVTGATGFLGSHLVKALLRDGHTVLILKRSHSACSRIAEVLPSLSVYDLDRDGMEAPFREHGKIDAILHAATCYGRKDESLAMLVEANVAFPLQLLEMAVRFGTPLFLNTDTFSSAPAVLPGHLRGYNLTKKQFREWGRSIAETHPIHFLNVRLEHLYGPFDADSKFVSYVINRCLRDEPELSLTAGEQQRDFIFVEDAVSAYSVLLRHGIDGSNGFTEYQVGTGTATSIREFVELVHRMTRSKTVLKFGALPYQENEIMVSQADIGPLLALGWSSKVTLEEGIRSIMEQLSNR